MTTMKRLSGVCVLILGFQLHVAVFAASTPTDTVKDTVEGVLATLADPSLDEQSQRYNVMTLIATRFNFPGMSKRILATNWKNADERQRERFVELFSQILGNTYWRRLRDYSNEKVEYVGEKIQNEKTARVKTIIITATNEIPVDYSLYKAGDGWLAYDVVIEGVSLVRNYRSSYQQIVKQEGIDGLMEKMADKVAENAAQ